MVSFESCNDHLFTADAGDCTISVLLDLSAAFVIVDCAVSLGRLDIWMCALG